MNEWPDEWGGGGSGDSCRDRQRETAELQTAALEGAVRQLAATPDGRCFLHWLVHGAGVFRAGFPAGHAEAAFMEGKRTVGLSVLQLCVNVGAAGIVTTREEQNHG